MSGWVSRRALATAHPVCLYLSPLVAVFLFSLGCPRRKLLLSAFPACTQGNPELSESQIWGPVALWSFPIFVLCLLGWAWF